MSLLDTTITNIITAIASLWQLVLITAIFFLLFIYRDVIRHYLKGFNKISGKLGEKEISFQRDENLMKENKQVIEASLTVISKEEPKEGTTEPEKKTKPSMWELYEVIKERKFSEAEKMFNDIQNDTVNDLDKIQNELSYLYFKYSIGGENSIPELIKKADEITSETMKSIAYSYVAQLYENLDHEKAIEFYNKAIAHEHEERILVTYYNSIAENYFYLFDIKKASSYLFEKIITLKLDKSKSLAFYKLSKLFEKNKNLDDEMLCLLQAVKYEPNNSTYLFDLAYLLADKPLQNVPVSAYLYSLLTEFSPNNAGAFNNLGVAYDNLNLRNEMHKAYRNASELGETLADANISIKLINIGFYNDAKKILEEALKKKSIHENVYKNLNEIKEKIKSETEEKSEVLEQAKKSFLLLTRISDFNTTLTTSFDWNKTFSCDQGDIIAGDIIDNERRNFIWEINTSKFSFQLYFKEKKVCIVDGKNRYSTYLDRNIKVYALLENDLIQILIVDTEVNKNYNFNLLYKKDIE